MRGPLLQRVTLNCEQSEHIFYTPWLDGLICTVCENVNVSLNYKTDYFLVTNIEEKKEFLYNGNLRNLMSTCSFPAR